MISVILKNMWAVKALKYIESPQVVSVDQIKKTVNIKAGKKLVSNAIWQAKNCFFVNADISNPIFKETIKYNVDTMQIIHKEPRIGTS